MQLIDVAPILKNIELDIIMLHGKADELGESAYAIQCTKDIVKLKDFAKWLKSIPTIDPESLRPTAHWKRIQDAGYMCTYCKSLFAFIPYNYQYCPICSAKMLNAYAYAREQ